MSDVEQQVRLLNDFSVQCVLIGGFAAFLQGASTLTRDIDICYSREDENLVRVVEALRSVNAVLRGAPREIKFVLDAETLKRGLNSDEAEIVGGNYRVLSLEKIISAKQAAGPRTCSHFLN